MKDETWARAFALFREAVELDPVGRRALIESHCSDDPELGRCVERLLEEDSREAGPLDRVVALPVSSLFDESTDGAVLPARIGSYRIHGVLGEGGMGTVYDALQDNPRRRVALKTLRFGAASEERVRRFLLEAQVLGHLSHPGIAQVHESGVHEEAGRSVPYFAMEYVREPRDLIAYADAEKLTREERLRLFLEVCEAVQHGHNKGVLHRDLKPSNLLVDASGRVKVIDFGLARTTESGPLESFSVETQAGQLLGTLAYASPEQLIGARSAADVRSDVYSLGAVLFELLAGETPHAIEERALARAVETLVSSDPRPLSAVRPELAGELEWIVGRALERDPDRRYVSVDALAADLRRHLAREPVLAAPPAVGYRLRKLARRHLAAIAAVSAVVLALAVGLVRARVEAAATRRALARAEREAAKAEGVSSFLRATLTSVSPLQGGSDVKVLDALREAERTLDVEFADPSEARAVVHNVLGQSYLGLRQLDGAESHLDAAQAWVAANLAPEAALALDVGANRVQLLFFRGDLGASLELGLSLAPRAERRLGWDHPVSLRLDGTVAELLLALRRLEEAEERYRAHLERMGALYGPRDPRLIGPAGGLALTRLYAGRGDAAEFEEIVDWCDEVLPPDHHRRWNAMFNLANALLGTSEPARAAEIYAEIAAYLRERFGGDHPFMWSTLNNQATALAFQGRHEEAIAAYDGALEFARASFGPDSANTMLSWVSRVDSLVEAGRFAEAEAEARGLLDEHAAALAVRRGLPTVTRAALARSLAGQGRGGEAVELLGDWLADPVAEDRERLESLLGDLTSGGG